MRRLTRRDDRGVATIFVVVALPALLMMACLVFDGARGVLVGRQAQSAADAAALAKATDCANNITSTNVSPYATVSGMSVSISNGSGCTTPCPAPNQLQMCVTATGTKQVTQAFKVEHGPWTVNRSATATWGQLTVATGVFPITIATCAFQGLKFGQKVTLHAKNAGTCTNPSGQFGWTNINCTTPTQVTAGPGFGIGGTTGNTPKSCTNAQLNNFLDTDVLVPVWDPTNTSCGQTYCITTFAEFYLTGWTGNGAANYNAQPPGTLGKQCDASGDGDVNYHENTPCIRGYFVQFTQDGGQSSNGPCNQLSGTQVLYACRAYLSS
jgi:Flp pilus assembly protein TadG